MRKLYMAILTLDNELVAEDTYGKRYEWDLNTENFPKWVEEGMKNLKVEVLNNKVIYC